MKKAIYLFLAVLTLAAFLTSGYASGPEDNAALQRLVQEATDAFNNRDFATAEKYYKEILRVKPDAKEVYYNLTLSQFNQEKFEEAAVNLYKATDLGYPGVPPELEMALRPYKYREFSVSLGKDYLFNFKGSSNCSVQLIRDILPGLGIYTNGLENISLVKPKFLQWGPDGKYWEEEWVTEGKEGGKTFSVTLTPTADGGTDYHIKLK